MQQAIPSRNNAVLINLSLGSLLVFIATALLVFVFHETKTDEAVFKVSDTQRNFPCTRFMLFITWWGKHSFLVPANLALIAFFLFLKNNKRALLTAVISIGGVSLMGLLKNLFARHRPSAPLVDGITNYSFPSGHAMMSVLFYGLLALLCFIYIKNKWLRAALIGLLLLFILLIGFSRIYLRVHYTTDVIAGYSFGLCWLCLCLYGFNKLVINKQKQ
jgi:undecaprenyl-diphosphatase